MIAGLSSLGVTLSYGTEQTAGNKPTTFKLLNRINSIGGITLSSETIDASALEDLAERSVAGRQTSGGSWNVVVNYTDETATEWTTLIAAYKTAAEANKRMWFQVSHPTLAKSFFVCAQPPQVIPMPSLEQNGLLTVEFTLTVDEYKGTDTKVAAS